MPNILKHENLITLSFASYLVFFSKQFLVENTLLVPENKINTTHWK